MEEAIDGRGGECSGKGGGLAAETAARTEVGV
jgi:hypothetical protein